MFAHPEAEPIAGLHPETLAAVLDHLLADESLLMVFAAGAGIDPAQILPARTTLGGRNEAGDGGITGAPAPVAKKKPSKRWPGP